MNPYITRLYIGLAALGVQVHEFSWADPIRRTWDIWHLHWPDGLLAERRMPRVFCKVARLIALMDAARFRGTKIVWTAHNIQSHEEYYPWIERWFWHRFVRRLDGVIYLSASGQDALREVRPHLANVPGFVIPQGHYRDVYKRTLNREDARTKLAISRESIVTAFIGQIRSYKNVPRLIEVFRTAARQTDILLIAGQPHDAEIERRVRQAADDDPRVRLSLEYIEDQKMQEVLLSADLSVFPFLDILNSSSAMLALSFDLPVLVPNRGAMGELRAQAGDAWVMFYEGDLKVEDLRRAMVWAVEHPRPSQPPLEDADWGCVVRSTLDAYQSIVG